jgi:hypothetical protein
MGSPVRDFARAGEWPAIRGLSTQVDDASVWDGNWAWSLPLILITVVFHVIGLVFINERVTLAKPSLARRRSFLVGLSIILGTATLVAIILHAIEAAIWAWVYQTLGALPDSKSALLYSLSAMTTYGHEHFDLANHWQLMGSLEALNGMILFGLTTAFLYGMIRELLTARRDNPA